MILERPLYWPFPLYPRFVASILQQLYTCGGDSKLRTSSSMPAQRRSPDFAIPISAIVSRCFAGTGGDNVSHLHVQCRIAASLQDLLMPGLSFFNDGIELTSVFTLEYLLIATRDRCQHGIVGDQAKGQNTKPTVPRHHNLWHGGHAYDVGTEHSQHAAFRPRFIALSG